jgi:hypothetical protein
MTDCRLSYASALPYRLFGAISVSTRSDPLAPQTHQAADKALRIT